MIHINEWDIPDWITLEWDATPPAWGTRPKKPAGAAAPPAGQLPRLVDTICRALERVKDGPRVVHFHGGEGLRWIRVGFAHDRTLKTEDVQRVGLAIAAQVGDRDGPLYFHALRPRDLVFFLPFGKADRVGMDARAFGMPLNDLLRAWGLEPPRPSRAASARPAAKRRGVPHAAPAPNSQRARSKP